MAGRCSRGSDATNDQAGGQHGVIACSVGATICNNQVSASIVSIKLHTTEQGRYSTEMQKDRPGNQLWLAAHL